MKKLISRQKKVFRNLFFFLALGFAVPPLFAFNDVVPVQLTSLAESILDAFTGDIAKIIIGICFAGSCVAYAFNKDNDRMKAKLVAVVVATGLLALSQVIVEKITNGMG